jgi:hypothetical protein
MPGYNGTSPVYDTGIYGDASTNLPVDFVWGNFPMQPNTLRTDGGTTVVVAADAAQNYDWSGYSVYPSGRLDAALDNHAVAEAGWAGYPSYYPAAGSYMVTAATGNGTTVTYTAQNTLSVGDVVNVTGLSASAYNLSSATVAFANAVKFTVTNAANAGEITGQAYGKVQLTTAATAADGAGIGNIIVPNVLGATTAVALDALKDAGYETASITTATAATNAAISVTAAARTAGSTTATLTATGAGAAFPVGTKITVASLADTGAPLNGTYTVTAVATNSVSFVSSASTVLALTGLAAGTIVGVAGTIKTQSTAAGTASVATTATITITPFATAS